MKFFLFHGPYLQWEPTSLFTDLEFLLVVFFVALLFTTFGYIHDSSLIWLKIILSESYSYGFLSLWIVFISYYGDVFNKLKELPLLFLAILGGIGGSLAYWSAYKLGALSISQDSDTFYLIFVFALWTIAITRFIICKHINQIIYYTPLNI